jgi:hypothetical protein
VIRASVAEYRRHPAFRPIENPGPADEAALSLQEWLGHGIRAELRTVLIGSSKELTQIKGQHKTFATQTNEDSLI